MSRLLAGLASLLLLVLVVAFGAAAFLLGTERGNALVREQIESIAEATLGPDVAVEVGGERFALPSFGTFGAAFSDVRITDRSDGRLLASIADASVGVSLSGLMRGRLGFDVVSVEGGRIDPSIADRFGSGPPNADRMLAHLDGVFAGLARMGLSQIEIADVSLLDSPPGNALARFDVSSGDEAGSFVLSAELSVGGDPVTADGTVALSADGRRIESLDLALPVIDLADRLGVPDRARLAEAVPRQLRTQFSVRTDGENVRTAELRAGVDPDPHAETGTMARADGALVYREGTQRLTLAPSDIDFGNVRATIRGEFALAPDEKGDRPITLRSERLVSTVGQPYGREALAGLEIDGALRADGTVDLPHLLLTLGNGSLRGSARWTRGAGPDARVNATLVAGNVSSADAKAFWPSFIASETRDWVLKHVGEAGRSESAAFSFDASAARVAEMTVPGRGPQESELRLDVSLANADFTTVGTIPRIRGASARIAVRGTRTVIDFDTAKVEGFDAVDVKPSRIEFTRATEGGVRSDLTLNLTGDLPGMLQVADREPIRALQRIGWKSDEIAGNAEMAINVSLLLGRGRRGAETLQGWSVLGTLEGADLKRPVEGRTLSNLTGTVSIAPGTAIGTLDGDIDGIRSKIEFTRPIEPEPVGQASLSVEAKVSEAQMRERLPALGRYVDGPATVKLVQTGQGFDIDADLADTRIAMPGLEWSKGRGVAARLTMKAVFQKTGASLSDIRLKGEGFSANGSAEIDARGLRLLSLDRASLNAGDDFSLGLTRTQNGFTAEVGGNQLDARPILSKLTGRGGGAGSGDGGGDGDIAVSARLQRLVGFGQEVLRDVSLRYETRGGSTSDIDLSATTDRGASVKGTLGGELSAQRIGLTTQDAGSLLRFAGVYPRMSGGQARVDLGGSKRGGYSGVLRVDNFTLVGEPRLASLVGTSGSGRKDTLAGALGRDLEVANAYFDTASASVSYRDGHLVAQDGIVRGPVFGSSFSGLLSSPNGGLDVSGSFMPAYGVNRLFGAIPFVGGILGNGAEGGLIGITYRLSGSSSDPTLAVNPISAIAPGIFRRIFEF